jgi:hypothetical protein
MKLGNTTMKVRFAALAGFVLASALPQLGHAQGYIQVPIPGIPGFVPPPPPQEREYRGWREHCEHLRDREHELRNRLAYAPPLAKSEEDWSTSLPTRITSESSAGAVENQNRSDRTPGDETLLARFGKVSTDIRNWTLFDIENWTPGFCDVAPRLSRSGLSR